MSLAQATDQLIQTQFAMFETICAQAGVTAEDQARFLDLPSEVWRRWRLFLAGAGPRPATPPINDLLLRIGATSFALVANARSAANS